MPDKTRPDKEPSDKRQFISEKIVEQPMTKKQAAKRVLAVGCLAAVFGVVSAVTFVLTRPFMERHFSTEPTTESQTVSIPRDEAETTVPVPVTTKASEPDGKELEELVKKAVEEYRFTMDDVDSLYANLKELGQQVDKGIVTVHSVRREMDWFDNPVENTGFYSGVIMAMTGDELIILVPETAVSEADALRVTFSDGYEADGTKKQTDKVSGMSVISVKKSAVRQETLDSVEVLKLANSHQMKTGDIVLAVGSPVGIAHSLDYGNVCYVAKNVQATDGICRVIYADVEGNAGAGTFLINTAGEVLGWVTDDYSNDNVSGMTAAVGVSDYKGILERMSNGKPVAYLGIRGQEITGAMIDEGLPSGIYISKVVAEGPAYVSGIQNGDILTEINGTKIATMREFQSTMEKLEPGAIITVTVERNGRDEYKELQYQVTTGAR